LKIRLNFENPPDFSKLARNSQIRLIFQARISQIRQIFQNKQGFLKSA
jgi:hypothetical protein